jgi:predicted XRE-type DNA-binding protein
MAREKIIKSSGNVFVDLGFPPAEASIFAIRSELIAQLRPLIERKRWTQAQTTEQLGITQSRVSDLIRGKWDKFSVDMLLVLAARAGLQPRLRLSKVA